VVWDLSETTHAQLSREAFCQFCGGKLSLGYHFACHLCDSAYCYIHMAKHAKAHPQQPVLTQAL
jgi:hypothetical protein